MTDHEDRFPDLDDAASRAARGLREHVLQRLDVEATLTGLPTVPSRRGRSRVAAVAAIAALLVGTVAVVGQRGDDGRVRIDLDKPLPDLEPGELSLLGPRDGKDSIQLPVTAEPSTDLRDGDEVTVTGEGFEPGESVGLVQCAREAGGETPETRGGVDGCYISDYTNITADGDGVATGTYRVHRVLTTPLTGTVDCAAEAERCIVAMGALNDYDRSGGTAITFASDVAPVDLPTVRVTPTEELTDRAMVHISADGLTPHEVLYAEVCSSDPVACWQTGTVVTLPESMRGENDYYYEGSSGEEAIGLLTDGDGRIEADIPVWRYLPGEQPGTYVDCAVSRCSLRLSGNTAPPTVPLHFASGGEPPTAPTLAMDPSTGVAPGDLVVVRGTGFAPGTPLTLSLCASLPGAAVDLQRMGYFSCAGFAAPGIVADGEGGFSVELDLPALGQLPTETEECDTDGQCRVVAPQGGGEDVRCDDLSSSCALTAEPLGYYGDGEGELNVQPPWFSPAPVPVIFR